MILSQIYFQFSNFFASGIKKVDWSNFKQILNLTSKLLQIIVICVMSMTLTSTVAARMSVENTRLQSAMAYELRGLENDDVVILINKKLIKIGSENKNLHTSNSIVNICVKGKSIYSDLGKGFGFGNMMYEEIMVNILEGYFRPKVQFRTFCSVDNSWSIMVSTKQEFLDGFSEGRGYADFRNGELPFIVFDTFRKVDIYDHVENLGMEELRKAASELNRKNVEEYKNRQLAEIEREKQKVMRFEEVEVIRQAEDEREKKKELRQQKEWRALRGDVNEARKLSNEAERRGDLDTAMKWLQVVAQHGDIDAKARYGIYLMDKGQTEYAKPFLSVAANSGDIGAILGMARIELGVNPTRASLQSASAWLEMAKDGDVAKTAKLKKEIDRQATILTKKDKLASDIQTKWFGRPKFFIVEISNLDTAFKYFPRVVISKNRIDFHFVNEGTIGHKGAFATFGKAIGVAIQWKDSTCFVVDEFLADNRVVMNLDEAHRYNPRNISHTKGEGCVVSETEIDLVLKTHIEVFKDDASTLKSSGNCKSGIFGGCNLGEVGYSNTRFVLRVSNSKNDFTARHLDPSIFRTSDQTTHRQRPPIKKGSEIICKGRYQDRSKTSYVVDCSDRKQVVDALHFAWKKLRGAGIGGTLSDICFDAGKSIEDIHPSIQFDPTMFLNQCNLGLAHVD